jgi:hypothetical protein
VKDAAGEHGIRRAAANHLVRRFRLDPLANRFGEPLAQIAAKAVRLEDRHVNRRHVRRIERRGADAVRSATGNEQDDSRERNRDRESRRHGVQAMNDE